MSIIIKGGNNNALVNVTSGSELQVALGKNINTAGYAVVMNENDAGYITGTPYLKSAEVSGDYRLRVGMDTLYFIDTFNYTAQNTSNWIYRTSTLTTTWSGGFMNLNGAANTAAGSTSVQTYKYFPLYGASSLYVEMSISFSAIPPANWQAEFGLMTLATTAPFASTDGAFFKVTSDGIYGVMNYNTTETSTDLLYPASSIEINANKKFTMVISEDEVEFWMDDVLLGEKSVPSGNGQPFMGGSQPFAMRLVQPGIAGLACQLRISDLIVSQSDLNVTKPWAYQMAGTGHMAYQGQNGGTMGSTSLMPNGWNPVAAAITNTTASASAVGLGGQYHVLPTLTANTDGILCSFQNPAGSNAITPRTLVINGVNISSVAQSALATSGSAPVIFVVSLAYGGTAVSLATAESATAKAPRKIPLGIISFPGYCVAGTMGQTIEKSFETPVVLNPGEYLQVVIKNIGTITVSGTAVFVVGYDGYFQ